MGSSVLIVKSGMEKSITELNGKLKTLKFPMSKTEEIISKHDKKALERQRLSLQPSQLRLTFPKKSIEEMMFGNSIGEEEIKQLAEESETLLSQADQCIRERK